MDKKEVLQLLEESNLRPGKRFGQNFLINAAICRKIVDAAKINEASTVLEIGPGLGALTELLVETGARLSAVEIDRGLYTLLQARFAQAENLRLIQGDALKIEIPSSLSHVVSNLPYYCASEILFRVIEKAPERIVVMMQKEMIERIKADPGSKQYGALTLGVTLRYSCGEIIYVGKNSFYPRPDVDSAVIVLERKVDAGFDETFFRDFHELVKTLFWGRRKTVLKCLVDSPHISLSRDKAHKMLAAAEVDPAVRGESLSLETFITLTKQYQELYK